MRIRSTIAGVVFAALTASVLSVAQSASPQPAAPGPAGSSASPQGQIGSQPPSSPQSGASAQPQSSPQSQPSSEPGSAQSQPGSTANPPQDQSAGKAVSVEDELQLTPEQRAKLQPILQEEMSQIMAARNDPSLTTEQKRAKIQEIRQTEFPKIQALLTPEQRQKLADLQQKARQQQGLGQSGNRESNPNSSPEKPQSPQ